MPSDSVAGFLDRAQASRVLVPEQVEQLIRQPDIPQSDLASLCAYLLSRGVLTQFQADALRDGCGHDLSFAGYPVIDRIGPCRGGTAYRALHPSLRTPLVLRRFDPGAFQPDDDAAEVATRAHNYGTLHHPNLLPLLDAGVYQGLPYAVLEQPADTANLATILGEVGGAMPGFLAAEYGWSIASALRAIHERGGWHGEVRPGLLLIGPLVTKTREDGTVRRRPAPNATVKLAETGLIPKSPPAARRAPDADMLPYLPPERIDQVSYEARGDIYGLGASLFLLLSGRTPFTGDSPEETLNKIRYHEPPPLASLRPDLPPELAALVMKMMAKRPGDRPQTAADVCQALAPFCRPGTTSAVPSALAVPEASPASSVTEAKGVPTADLAEPAEESPWGVNPNAFAVAHAASASDTRQPRRRQLTSGEKARSKMWIAVGLLLHLTAVGLLVAWALGAFSSPPAPTTEPESRKTQPSTPKKKDKDKNKKQEPVDPDPW